MVEKANMRKQKKLFRAKNRAHRAIKWSVKLTKNTTQFLLFDGIKLRQNKAIR